VIVRFDEAFRAALDVTRAARAGELLAARRVVLVRDLLGRLRLVVDGPPGLETQAVDARLRTATGPFFAGLTLSAKEMVAPDVVLDSPDVYEVEGVPVLERVVTTADWTRAPLPNELPRPPRATLYGVKGGVGRSTALIAWARHLAQHDERVLVVDLDLESPGVSSTLLPAGAADYGVVDWFVEEAVGNADDELVRRIVVPSPLADGTTGTGSVLVAPCGGADDDNYLAKLARCYMDIARSEGGARTFAERLAEMIDALERAHQPTVVLLDSRAGLHDLAAIATTRLDAMTFLFAVDSRQTWNAYRTLLANWSARPQLARDLRERLRIVAAQVPETQRESYLERLRLSAYDLFEPFYEEATPESPNAFNFDIAARDAPHFPLPVHWARAFQDWDPLSGIVTQDEVRAAFGEFLDAATDLVLDRGPEDGQG
jgi:hypothetical protein